MILCWQKMLMKQSYWICKSKLKKYHFETFRILFTVPVPEDSFLSNPLFPTFFRICFCFLFAGGPSFFFPKKSIPFSMSDCSILVRVQPLREETRENLEKNYYL